MKTTFKLIREKTRLISPILSMIALLFTLCFDILFIITFTELQYLDQSYITTLIGQITVLTLTFVFVVLNFIKPNMGKTLTSFAFLLLLFSNNFESIAADSYIYIYGITIGYELVTATYVILIISFVSVGLACILTFVNVIFQSMSVKLYNIPSQEITRKDNRIALEDTLTSFGVRFIRIPFILLMVKSGYYLLLEMMLLTVNRTGATYVEIESGLIVLPLFLLIISIFVLAIIGRRSISNKKKFIITSAVFSLIIIGCIIGIIADGNLTGYTLGKLFPIACGSFIVLSFMGLALSLFSLIVLRNKKDYYNDGIIVQ